MGSMLISVGVSNSVDIKTNQFLGPLDKRHNSYII